MVVFRKFVIHYPIELDINYNTCANTTMYLLYTHISTMKCESAVHNEGDYVIIRESYITLQLECFKIMKLHEIRTILYCHQNENFNNAK